MSSSSKIKYVNCPLCGKKALWSPENPFRPFCSERCKMIDLGQWATENYRIPVTEDNPLQGEDEK